MRRIAHGCIALGLVLGALGCPGCASNHGSVDAALDVGAVDATHVVRTCDVARAAGYTAWQYPGLECEGTFECPGCPTVRCFNGHLQCNCGLVCGDVGPGPLDAATVSPPDTDRVDVWPRALPITVVVEDTSGAPAARQRVVFHDAAGAPVDEASTDALGMASSTRPGIAAITVEIDAPVLPWSGSDGARLYLEPGLFSVWGVTPGETITFDMLVAERRVVVPAPPTGTSYVALASPVGSTADPARPTLVWDGIASTSILALAEPDTTTGPLAYTTSIGDRTPGTITLPPWRTDYDGVPYAVMGAPAGLELYVGASTTTDMGDLAVSVATTAPSGTLQVMRGLPPGAPIGIYASASEPPYMGTPTWTSYEVFVAAGAGPVLLDLSRAPVIGPTALDPASLRVSWTTPVDAHVATSFLGFTDTTGNITNWTVMASGTATGVSVPQLPRDLAWHLPMRGGPAIQWNVAVVRFDCAFDPVAYRAHPWARVGPCEDGVVTGVGGQTAP